jgi:hypothetical protein
MTEDHSNSKHIFQNCLNFKDWKQHKLYAPIILGELQLGYLITTLLVFHQCVQFNAHHSHSRHRQRIKTAKEMFHIDSHVSDPATCGNSFKNFNYKHESLNHIQCKTRSIRQLGSHKWPCLYQDCSYSFPADPTLIILTGFLQTPNCTQVPIDPAYIWYPCWTWESLLRTTYTPWQKVAWVIFQYRFR